MDSNYGWKKEANTWKGLEDQIIIEWAWYAFTIEPRTIWGGRGKSQQTGKISEGTYNW
jgi:hypothetical protein